jgi:twitching motility protein PilT
MWKANQLWVGGSGDAEVRKLLHLARDEGATDVHILAGSPVYARIEGDLTPLSAEILTASLAKHLACALIGERQQALLEEHLDVDVMCVDTDGQRYRVNVGYANGTIGAVIRLLPRVPIPLEELHLPPIVEEVTHRGKGLVLVTGSTSQGKTTTMASMVDAINRHSRKHVVTIEDPIEYLHPKGQSLVRQRELGRDTKSFAAGLRAALRQDPDVVLIGEMRDFETIDIALRAAASGVMVISTLHIVALERMMDRLLAYALPGRENLIRTMTSEVLSCVIHQELLPTVDGGKRVACEILIGTRAVRNTLKSGTETGLRTALMSGRDSGMVTMQMSLDELFADGQITEAVREDVMRNYAAVS